jgi:hypothetical protein
MSRADQYAVTVTADGVNLGVWDKLEGGEIDSEETKYKPGGMLPQVSLGGTVEVGNVTVSRLYSLDSTAVQMRNLRGRVGKANMVVNRQSLDTDGNAYGPPWVYKGKLKTLTLPEVDSESSDAAVVALEITPAGTVG